MNEKADRLLARLEAVRTKGSKSMRLLALASEVAERLITNGSVARDEIRTVMLDKAAALPAGNILQIGYEEAAALFDTTDD